MERIARMPELRHGHFCYYVNPCQDLEEHGGYVPSIVVEHEGGHYPLTGDPTKLQAPIVWGRDLKLAESLAADKNRSLGLTDDDVARIIASSMRGMVPRMAT